MTPEVAFGRFLMGVLCGGVIGLIYCFLRPLQRGRAVFADLLFVLGAGWALLYYGFAICRGDLRFGYLAAVAVGIFLFNRLCGWWLRPIFRIFWYSVGLFLLPVRKIFKKTRDFIKFLFASAKKWVTIKRKRNAQKGAHYAKEDRFPPDLSAD